MVRDGLIAFGTVMAVQPQERGPVRGTRANAGGSVRVLDGQRLNGADFCNLKIRTPLIEGITAARASSVSFTQGA